MCRHHIFQVDGMKEAETYTFQEEVLQFLPIYYHANDEPSQAHAPPQQSKLPSLFADPDDYAI